MLLDVVLSIVIVDYKLLNVLLLTLEPVLPVVYILEEPTIVYKALAYGVLKLPL